jgi:hypothetical protein
MEVIQEYWVFMDETDILGIFETIQECLEWKPLTPVKNPNILRVKQFQDGSFRYQRITLNSEMYT